MALVHPHRFDLRAQGPAAGQAGDEGELQGADDLGAGRGDNQQLGGVGVDRLERLPVRLQVLVTGLALSGATQRISYEQDHEGTEIVHRSPA